MLWDLNEGKHLYSLEAGDIVNALVFSPNRYWLCAATASCVKIFDLESKYVAHFIYLVFCVNFVFLDRSWMNSSLNSWTLALSRGTPNVCRSHGLLTARHCSGASPTTSSVSGLLLLKIPHGKLYLLLPCIKSLRPRSYTSRARIRAGRVERLDYNVVHYSPSASVMLRLRSLKSQRSSPPKSILIAPEDKLT